VFVDNSSINRWSIRFLLALEKIFRKHKRPVGVSWRTDETYIKVKGIWKYLYRAVDKEGVACFIGSPAMNFMDASSCIGGRRGGGHGSGQDTCSYRSEFARHGFGGGWSTPGTYRYRR